MYAFKAYNHMLYRYQTLKRILGKIYLGFLFCILTAQGGCEGQVSAHVNGNVAMGNGKEGKFIIIQKGNDFNANENIGSK